MDKYTPPSAREEASADWNQYVHDANVSLARRDLTETPEEALRVVLDAIGLDYDATIEANCPDMPVFRAVAEIYSATMRGDQGGVAAGAEALAVAFSATLEKLAEERAA